MNNYHSTPQVARLLGIKPDTLSKAIWQGRVKPPQKSPSGQYLWTDADIEHASWALLHKSYADDPQPMSQIIPDTINKIRSRCEKNGDLQ